MQQMQNELNSAAHMIRFVGINAPYGLGYQSALTGVCDFPLFQDTVPINAFALHKGNKDDIFVYDATGSLRAYLPAGGPIDTNLSTTTGYDNLKQIVVDAL